MTSDEQRETNLRALHRQYYTAPAQRAASFLATTSPERKERALQSHLLREPAPTDIERRDDLDYLLRYYSVLELAAMTSAVPDPLPALVTTSARALLSDEHVRRYYEKYYPLLLPQLFLRRLDGTPIPTEFPTGNHADQLARFLTISRLRDTPEIDTFLWFLDDGTEPYRGNEYSLTNILSIIRDGERLVQRLRIPIDQQTPADRGLHGLSGFIRFSRALCRYLEEITSTPLWQSACWHLHGYWFQQLGAQLLGVITAGIELYRTHASPTPAEVGIHQAALTATITGNGFDDTLLADELTRTHDDMDAAIRDLQLLTSGIYRAPLEAYILQGAAPSAGRAMLLDGLRVLVLDDDASMRRLLSYSLRKSGATVVTTESISEATTALVDQQFDLVISDIVIGTDKTAGITFARRANEDANTIGVIGISEFANAENIDGGLFKLFIRKQELRPEELGRNLYLLPEVAARIRVKAEE